MAHGRIIALDHGFINKDDSMTRIRRMHISVDGREEWISLLAGDKPNTYRVIPEGGEEFEFTDDRQQPLEKQLAGLLSERSTDTV
jgi:hypothetical protein